MLYLSEAEIGSGNLLILTVAPPNINAMLGLKLVFENDFCHVQKLCYIASLQPPETLLRCCLLHDTHT